MKRVGRALQFLAWAAFFVFAAVVLALRYWVLPDIERYRNEIVAAVSATVGLPVRIGRIDAGWRGLNPRIHLSDVHVFDPSGEEVLVLPWVDNVVSWRSVERRQLVLRSLIVDGLRLQVRRDAGGALFVGGRRVSGESVFVNWALAQGEIVLNDAQIEWRDEARQAPPLALSHLNLRMRNTGRRHAVGVTATPPPALGSTLELRAVLEGRAIADPASWSGRVYAEIGYTDLAAWRPWIDYPIFVERGQGAVRLWAALRTGAVTQATLDVAAVQVSARLGKALAPLELASVRGRLRARILDGGYEVAARKLALELPDGTSVAPTDFDVTWKQGERSGESSGSAMARELDLQPLATLAGGLPLPQGVHQLLARMAPRGRLDEVSLDWRGPTEAPDRFTAHGRFSQLAASATGNAPGFSGVSGHFEATDARGRVELASRKAHLDLPAIFAEGPIALDYLSGQIDWQREAAGGVVLRSSSVVFSNDDVSGNLNGSYAYDGNGPGVADLFAQLNRADARHLGRYLPRASLMGGAKTRDWLTRAILAGHSSDVRLRLQGDLRDFPFTDPLRGQFSVAAHVEKGVLEFAPGWPRISGIDAALLFERDRMQITGRRGDILGAALAKVKVTLPHLGAEAPRLSIEGRAEGETAAFLRFIRESPVRAMLDGLTDPMSASGRGQLHLEVKLPLKNPGGTRVAGEFAFAGNSVKAHADLPPIERAEGKVAFTDSSVTLRDVHGRLFGGDLRLSGGTRPDKSIVLMANGDAAVAGLQPLFGSAWARYLSGSAPYNARLELRNGTTRLTVGSSLRGLASSLPAPFGKSAVESLELQLQAASLGDTDRLTVQIGRATRAEVHRRRDHGRMALERASLALGARPQPIRLPESRGILIYGSLAALDLDAWSQVLGDNAGASGGEDRDAAFDLRLGTLDAYGKRLHDVSLRGRTSGGGWSASVAARELAGELAYAGEAPGKLTARLGRFRAPDDTPGARARKTIDPARLPSIELGVEHFALAGQDLGRLELSAVRDGRDLRIDRLTMTNPDASLTGSGAWRSGAPARVALGFEIKASDAGNLLGRLGYAGVVKGGRAELRGSLSWVGHPAAIDYPSLAGEVDLRAEDGQFLEIEPGFGKLISLMSLQSLPRRITLDFRDVFSKGFEFQRIESSGRIEQGRMAVKRFQMRGAGAEVQMTGAVDLAHETQNHADAQVLRLVRVGASLGDSASTLIGLVHPLLAIPAAIAQKLLKDPLGQIFAFDYAITGAWADPKVAKVKIETRPAEAAQGGQP